MASQRKATEAARISGTPAKNVASKLTKKEN